MKHDSNIESLITKFNLGSITHDELATLVESFKENEPESELLDIYQKAWERAAYEKNELNTSGIYASVIKKLNIDEDVDFAKSEKPLYFLKNVWKYAAVFIAAFALSWFLNNKLQNPNSELGLVAYQNIEVPYGSKTKVILPDGSKVNLNSGSKLRYASAFGSQARIVYLEGEAFFDVKKDNGLPFYVNVSGIKIKVLGTSFNVKAYPEEKTIETTLISGSVQIFKDDAGKESANVLATLKPSQKAVYEKENGRMDASSADEETTVDIANAPSNIQIEENVKPELSTAWKDNQLVFDNERFADLTTRIERWYNVEIVMNYPALKEARFSGKFDKETIEQAIEALTLVTPFHFKIEKNKVLIYK